MVLKHTKNKIYNPVFLVTTQEVPTSLGVYESIKPPQTLQRSLSNCLCAPKWNPILDRNMPDLLTWRALRGQIIIAHDLG